MRGGRGSRTWREVVQVQTTFGRREDAERIGRLLVGARLAACVQILGPIGSIYRWQGAIETAEEWLCLLKTTVDGYPALEERLRQEHPYEEPEIVALPIQTGTRGYLRWVVEGVTDGPARDAGD